MGGRALLVLATVLVGCGNKQAASNLGEDSANIVNGSNVTAPNKYSKHTVFIQTRTAQGGGICTGSIYDSKTILTAAHCMVGAEQAAIVFASSPRDQNSVSRANVRRVGHVIMHPGFVPRSRPQRNPEEEADPTAAATPAPRVPTVDELAGMLEENNVVMDDVALVQFEGGLPEGYSAVQLATSESLSQPGAQMHMIGYGLARVGSESRTVNGQARLVPVPDRATTGQLRETEAAIARYMPRAKLILTDSRSTGVCSGDSGGPAFVTDPATGAVVQVGIAEAVANSYCNSVSMHTAVVPYLPWIREAAAQLAEQAAQNTPMF